MGSLVDIFLVTEDVDTENAIKSVFNENEGLSLTEVYQRITDAEQLMSEDRACILIVDIDKDYEEILSKLTSISDRYPDKRIVIISSSLNQDLILHAMRSGARQFLVKESLEKDLSGVLNQLIPQPLEMEQKLGSVVSVFSSSGGCGATTIATNLANEIHLTEPDPLLLVDLDSCYGSIAAYLGFSGPTSIRDLLEYEGDIDRHLIESCSYNYQDKFHVLANPSGFETPQTVFLRYDKVLNIVRISRESYKYILHKGLAKISDLVLIVFQGTVKDMNYARSIVASLLKAGVEREKIVLIANRYKKRVLPMKLDEIKKVLGVETIFSLRSDWKRTARSINDGKLLSEISRWSGIRRDYQKIVALVSSQNRNGSGRI
ncbi:MAG: hypothetical protein ACYTE8_09550 [Planctomycetota bacterium]|jgi:pilus assembly protein CpaE